MSSKKQKGDKKMRKKYPIYTFKDRENGEIMYIGPDKYKFISDRYESKLHCTCNSYDEMRKLQKNLNFLYQTKMQ